MHWNKSNHCSSSALAAPHHSSKWLRAGCRAAAGGGGSHGSERLGWMAASSRCSVLGSGKVNIAGNRWAHTQRFLKPLTCNFLLLFQMHVAELLVSHGASLNAKTFLDETPIGIFTPHSISAPGGGLKKQISYLSRVSFPDFSVNASVSMSLFCCSC